MQRRPDSHKGENGKVTIVGGSRTMHGAPLLSALAAEASGVDLVFVCVPACHEHVAKATSLNFQVFPFAGDELQSGDVESVLELLATMDSAVLGPGIARDQRNIKALNEIIAAASCQLVLDATGLQPETLALVAGKDAVLTPHLGELERMGIMAGDMGEISEKFNTTILLKGPVARIASPNGDVAAIKGGNAGLTVGGTGDALAGLIAGLRAQGMSAGDACTTAATIVKRAGTILFGEKGYAYTAKDVIGVIPGLLHGYDAVGA